VLFFYMTRIEAIAIINAKLASLDDEEVMAMAYIVQDIADMAASALDLSDARISSAPRKTSRPAATQNEPQSWIEITASDGRLLRRAMCRVVD